MIELNTKHQRGKLDPLTPEAAREIVELIDALGLESKVQEGKRGLIVWVYWPDAAARDGRGCQPCLNYGLFLAWLRRWQDKHFSGA